MKKIISILMSLTIFATMLVPFSALASEINTVQTAETISVGESKTQTYEYGYPTGDYSSYISNNYKYYRFTAPTTDYYEFQLTGFENSVYYGTNTAAADFTVTDSSGTYVGMESVNDYTKLCKEAYQLTQGQTYYIEVYSDVSSIASYHDYDYGYATQTLTLTVRNHVHSMKVSYQGSYITSYVCEYCNYGYTVDNECQHKNTKKTVITSATYWNTGKYNIYCTDCGKTISTNLTLSKKAATLKSVKAGKKKATVKWKKVSGATGYTIQYSTKKNMKGAKTVNVKGGSKTSKTIKKLKKGKKYYFRVRAKKGKKTSSYSKVKSVKVK